MLPPRQATEVSRHSDAHQHQHDTNCQCECGRSGFTGGCGQTVNELLLHLAPHHGIIFRNLADIKSPADAARRTVSADR